MTVMATGGGIGYHDNSAFVISSYLLSANLICVRTVFICLAT